MRILGIETSCDETAVALIEISGAKREAHLKVLSNVVSSQIKLHARFGGVVPHLAKREHQRNLVPVLLQTLRESSITNQELKGRYIRNHNSRTTTLNSILEREPEFLDRIKKKILTFNPPPIDAIAVTQGPGLAPALWVGVNFARALSYLWSKPLIAVNHLEGHIYTNLLPQLRGEEQVADSKSLQHAISHSLLAIRFPALCLIVSGGHTELVLMRRYGKYEVLGETLDDAAGEAFDKVAKMMKLGFPGGPIISHLAESGNSKAFSFPRPMMQSGNFNFSFSGLKTSVLYTIERVAKRKPLNKKQKRDIAASFEQAVVDVLVVKTIRAAKKYHAKTVMIGGGVAANRKLRAELGTALDGHYPSAKYLVPNASLTGDNALMIALAGYFGRDHRMRWQSLEADANLRLDGKTRTKVRIEVFLRLDR